MEPRRPRRRYIVRPEVRPQLRELRPLQPVSPRALPAEPTNQRLSVSRKRSPVMTACEPCRKRKIKCDGQRPECAACSENYRSCHFISDSEESRIGVLKRTLGHKTQLAEDLRQSCDKLNKILDALKSRSEPESAAILKLIRQGDDYDTILLHLQVGHQLLELKQKATTTPSPPPSPLSMDSSSRNSQSSEDTADVPCLLLGGGENLCPEQPARKPSSGGPYFPHNILNNPKRGAEIYLLEPALRRLPPKDHGDA